MLCVVCCVYFKLCVVFIVSGKERREREGREDKREKGRERRGDREEKKNKINNKKYNENTSTYTRGEGVTFACVRRCVRADLCEWRINENTKNTYI